MMRLSPKTLKSFRMAHGFTQQSLAEKIGITRNTVNRWEMGLNKIPLWCTPMLFEVLEPLQQSAKKKPAKKKGGTNVPVRPQAGGD